LFPAIVAAFNVQAYLGEHPQSSLRIPQGMPSSSGELMTGENIEMLMSIIVLKSMSGT